MNLAESHAFDGPFHECAILK